MKKTIIKTLQLLLPIIFLANVAIAQHVTPSAKVSGLITDKKNKRMDYTTVSLLKANDTSVVKSTLTNDTGYYAFEHIAPGSYVIRATEVGYKKTTGTPFTVLNDASTVAPVLQVAIDSRTLNTVTITASKPMIERTSDRTVMNVENSILAGGNSAMEILARAPGVAIDQNDNISLNGKQGVTVMINGKLTYLSATQLATLLRSTDGTTIKSIELITNPSAKYDAAGNSGIIDIKLKKNTQSGTNGTVTVGAGYGKDGKARSTISLNHKQGTLDIFGMFSHNDDKTGSTANLKRIVTDTSGSKTYFNQLTAVKENSHNNSYRFGADYDFSSKNTIGFVVNGYFNSEKDQSDNPTYVGQQPGLINSYQNTLSTIDQTYKNFALNLNDKFKLDTNGQELNIDLDYSLFNNNSQAQYDTYFFLPDGSSMDAPEFLREQTPSVIHIRAAKADYILPLNKTLKLEAGVKYSDVKTNNNLQAQQQVNTHYVNDTTLTNRFTYDEKIAAGYLNLTKTYANTTIQAGLRAEHTNSTGDLINTNQVVTRHYLDFFPSVFINHTINDKNEIGLSYSRRIDRPGYDDLNPFVYYIDQYTYSKGNPFLNPQYSNHFEVNYGLNHAVNISLGYSHTANAITGALLTDAETNLTVQTKLNVQSQDYYDLNVNAPYIITKWWTGNVNGVVFYNSFKSDSLLGGIYNRGQLSFHGRATQLFQVAAGYRAELTSNYTTAVTYGIYHVKPGYSNDIGMSHSFDDKKANIKFSVSDVLNSMHDRVSSMYQTNNLAIDQKPETRIARLTFTYNFGNIKLKIRRHQDGDSEEKQRVKGAN